MSKYTRISNKGIIYRGYIDQDQSYINLYPVLSGLVVGFKKVINIYDGDKLLGSLGKYVWWWQTSWSKYGNKYNNIRNSYMEKYRKNEKCSTSI